MASICLLTTCISICSCCTLSLSNWKEPWRVKIWWASRTAGFILLPLDSKVQRLLKPVPLTRQIQQQPSQLDPSQCQMKWIRTHVFINGTSVRRTLAHSFIPRCFTGKARFPLLESKVEEKIHDLLQLPLTHASTQSFVHWVGAALGPLSSEGEDVGEWGRHSQSSDDFSWAKLGVD